MNVVKYLKKTKFLGLFFLVLASNVSYSDYLNWGYNDFGGKWLFTCTGFDEASQNGDIELAKMNVFYLKGFLPSSPLTSEKLLEDNCAYGERETYMCQDSETGAYYVLKYNSVQHILANPQLSCSRNPNSIRA